MPKIKYQVTDKNGRVHTRTTTHRIYSHCVVAHLNPRPATKYFAAAPAASFAEWAGRLDLAQNVARRWQRAGQPGQPGVYLESVEILIAQQVS